MNSDSRHEAGPRIDDCASLATDPHPEEADAFKSNSVATPVRVCRTCQVPYLLTASNFYVVASCRGGFATQCKGCVRIERREGKRRAQSRRTREARERRLREALARGLPCPRCSGLAHRVSGPRCHACGLAYREEAPPPLELRGGLGFWP